MGNVRKGVNFEQAKERNNKYAVYVNCQEIIKGATFKSALDNFKTLQEDIQNKGAKDEVCLAKIFDRKTKSGRAKFGFKVMKSNKKERIGEYVG